MIERDFNEEAGGWDAAPQRVRVAEAVADCLARVVPWTGMERVLDYGCGTGLVTLRLAARVGGVVAVDAAPNMIAQLRGKLAGVAAAGAERVQALVADLERGDVLPGPWFDAVVCTQTLNHVREPARVLAAFHALLRPGGTIAISEMEAGDGSTGGWPRGRLQAALAEAGFEGTGAWDALVIPGTSGGDAGALEKRYYVCTARRRP